MLNPWKSAVHTHSPLLRLFPRRRGRIDPLWLRAPARPVLLARFMLLLEDGAACTLPVCFGVLLHRLSLLRPLRPFFFFLRDF